MKMVHDAFKSQSADVYISTFREEGVSMRPGVVNDCRHPLRCLNPERNRG